MASISVAFEIDGEGNPSQDVASITLDGPTDKTGFIAPNDSRDFEVQPGVYNIRASVTTRPGVNWKVTVSPEGGTDKSASGTGQAVRHFSNVRVDGDDIAVNSLRALVAQPDAPTMTDIHLKLTVPAGSKWSATVSSDGNVVAAINDAQFALDERRTTVSSGANVVGAKEAVIVEGLDGTG